MSAANPFSLSIPDADLDLLRRKLELARFPDELDDAGWDYGVPLPHIKRLVDHWLHRFDWRSVEAHLNQLPMFTQDIEVQGFSSLSVHYVHKRSNVPNAIPLLFVHGWPGSFLEVRKILPLLTAPSPGHPSFHVIAPSLPGFAFSEAPHKPGFAGYQYAELLNKLMLSLGYDEYVYQGGDFGHTLGVYAVNKYGHKHIKAWHTNMPVYRIPTFVSHPFLYLEMLTMPINEYIRDVVSAALKIRKTEMGYYNVQATRPQTLAYGHTDSPIGFLAWVYERLIKGSDSYPWTDDEVLEWVSVYWFSRAGPAACTRIYYELSHGNTTDLFVGTTWTSVPLGVSYFPKEPIRLPEQWSHTIGKVVFQARHDQGGHFAAFEQPKALVEDLRNMFGKGGSAYGVVRGKDGY